MSFSVPAQLFGWPASRWILLLLTLSTLLRLGMSVSLPILPDESYYFQWSKHLDASYFSKGPAIAYTIAAGTALWGPNVFGIRFFAVLLAAGTAWQLFLLARRWFDETTAVIAVVLSSVIPIYALGALVMTIDPLSAFFWLWAANWFSDAVEKNRPLAWFMAGFAVGAGFLAKPLNGLELLAFLAFLAWKPALRHQLIRPGFWLMLLTASVCTLPIWWWNQQHGWPMINHLQERANLENPWTFAPSFPLKFLLGQALVISPVMFVLLLVIAVRTLRGLSHDGARLMLFLFASVFLFYFILSFHYVGEANWPTISYFSLIILLAAQGRDWLAQADGFPRWAYAWVITAFLLGALEMMVLHATALLPLKGRMDPLSRFTGWKEMAAQLQEERQRTNIHVMIADGYKEAAVLSFYLPDQAFVFERHQDAVRNPQGQLVTPYSNQYDFWPGYATETPGRALYLTENPDALNLRQQFKWIQLNREITVLYRGTRLRHYYLFQCENP